MSTCSDLLNWPFDDDGSMPRQKNIGSFTEKELIWKQS